MQNQHVYHKLLLRGSRQLCPGSTDTASLQALAKNQWGLGLDLSESYKLINLLQALFSHCGRIVKKPTKLLSDVPESKGIVTRIWLRKLSKSTQGAAIQPLPSFHLISLFLKTTRNRKFWATREICATVHFASWFALRYPQQKHANSVLSIPLVVTLALLKVHPCLEQLD